MTRRSNGAKTTPIVLLLGAAAVIAALYFAKEVLLPFALAVLLVFVLVPVVRFLERLRIGRIPAVFLVAVLVFGVIGSAGWVVTYQVIDLSGKLPQYKNNLVNRVRAVSGSTRGKLERATETIEDIGKELSEPPVAKAEEAMVPAASDERDDSPSTHRPAGTNRIAKSPAKSDDDAVAVKVVELPPSPLQQLNNWLGPLVAPLSTAGLVAVFVIFILISHEDLRDRLIHVIGRNDLHSTTDALSDASGRLGRYLRAQLAINFCYGLIAGLGLHLLGVPNAPLWGVLGMLLRFLPYVGPWMAAAMPVLVSFAVFEGWLEPLLAIAMFITLDLLINLVFEPWLYGKSIGVSNVGIIVSAVFWAWLWGPEGLLLAVPLTVCLVVFSKQVPALEFVGIMLSDKPGLKPEMRFYQRLLAFDDDEVQELVETKLCTTTPAELFDSMLIPALSLAERDRHSGVLDKRRQQFIIDTTRDIIEDLADRGKLKGGKIRGDQDNNVFACNILCVPAFDESDEVVAIMVAQLLMGRACQTSWLTTHALAAEIVAHVEQQQIDVVFISGVPPMASRRARYLCKRLRKSFPQLKILVGLWYGDQRAARAEERLMEAGANLVVTKMTEAVQQAAKFASAIALAKQHQERDAEEEYVKTLETAGVDSIQCVTASG